MATGKIFREREEYKIVRRYALQGYTVAGLRRLLECRGYKVSDGTLDRWCRDVFLIAGKPRPRAGKISVSKTTKK